MIGITHSLLQRQSPTLRTLQLCSYSSAKKFIHLLGKQRDTNQLLITL
jgi:hypothetical protein